MNCIMLTGATSMIGCALIKECVKNNVCVIALVRKDSSKLSRLPASPLVKIVECDLDQMKDLDSETVRKLLPDNAKPGTSPDGQATSGAIGGRAAAGASPDGRATSGAIDGQVTTGTIDCFYHFGWTFTDHEGRNNPEKQEMNIRYTLDTISLASQCGCKKFIGAGSQAEYGRAAVPLNGDVPCRPEVAYGVAKYAAGLLAAMKCRELGLEFNWVRILSVYGTNDSPATLIKTFINNCKSNEPMKLGPCTHQWDYLFEDDAGLAFYILGNHGVDGKVYCLGSGDSRPLMEYLEEIRSLVNPSYSGACYGAVPYNEKSVTYLRADISSLSSDTGWKPSVSFRDGIGRML
ncbi:MAG: NAD(P)-dependent oxidoreductase [Treponema sp.]|nr:NAD(P)-dependent oxidoreductase [Treponema sp.]